MKNKLLLLLILLIPFGVKAASLSVSCPATATPNSEVECTITAYDTLVSGASAKVSVENGSISSSRALAPGILCGADTTTLTCVSDEVENSMNVASYKIKVGESGTTIFKLDSAQISGENYTTTMVGTIIKNITIDVPIKEEIKEVQPTPAPIVAQVTKDENKKETKVEEKKEEIEEEVQEETPEVVEEVQEEHGIKSLTIEGIEFNFDPNRYNYNINYTGSISTITFNYVTFSENDEISISNNKLVDGENNIVVECKYNDSTIKYNFTIYKAPYKLADKKILSFIIIGFIIWFIVVIVGTIAIVKKIRKNIKTKKRDREYLYSNYYEGPALEEIKEESLSAILSKQNFN